MRNVFSAGSEYAHRPGPPVNEDYCFLAEVLVAGELIIGKKVWDEGNRWFQAENLTGVELDIGSLVLFHRGPTGFVCLPHRAISLVEDMGTSAGRRVGRRVYYDAQQNLVAPVPGERKLLWPSDSVYHEDTPPWRDGRVYAAIDIGNFYVCHLPSFGDVADFFEVTIGEDTAVLQVDGEGNVVDFSAWWPFWKFDDTTTTWSKMGISATGTRPSNRTGHVLLINGNKLYILGGTDWAGNILNDAHEYDISTNTWASKSNSLGYRTDAVASEYDGSNYFWLGGGRDSTGFQADHWTLDPSTWTWTGTPPIPNAPRSYHRTRMIAHSLGGSIAPVEMHTQNPSTHLFFSPATLTWYSYGVLGASPVATDYSAVCTDKSNVHYCAGGTSATGRTNQFWSLDWTSFVPGVTNPTAALLPVLPVSVSEAGAAYANSKIHVFGGQTDDEVIDSHYRYSGGWTEYTGTKPAARKGHKMIADSAATSLYLFGGKPN